MSYLTIGCRCLLGLVLLAAVAGKARNRAALDEFADALRETGLVPSRWCPQVAVAVVVAEGTTGVLLALPGWTLAGFAAATVLFGVLAVGVRRVLRRGVRTTCPCFAAPARPLGRVHLARNAALVAVAVVGGAAALAGGAGHPHPGGTAIAVVAGAALAFLVIRIDDVAEAFEPSR